MDAEERNLERIGQRFGVTRERLRRIVRQLTADLELRRRLAAAADIALPDGE